MATSEALQNQSTSKNLNNKKLTNSLACLTTSSTVCGTANQAVERTKYFKIQTLFQQTSSDKQYQSLHRELSPPPPEYESYRVPQKSGAKDDDQAAKARVYEEPFLGKPEPKIDQDSPYTEIWKE